MNLTKINAVKPISDEFFNAIAVKLDYFYQASTAFKSALQSVMFEVNYQKNIHILNAGARQSIIWFSLEGIFQEFSVDQETFATRTSWFWMEFAFIYAMPGFFDQEPSQVTIKVLKDSLVAFISYENWKILRQGFEETDKLSEILRSHFETARKVHLNDLNTLSTEQRYLKCESKINQLCQQVKLQHIAEYLGMCTDTLGKLRRRLIKSPKSGK